MKIQHWCAAAMVAVLLALGIGAGSAPFGDVSSYGQKRLLSTNGTQSATWMVAGRVAVGQLAAARSVATADDYKFSLGKLQGEGRQRGVEIVFFGAGADNTTVNYRVWRLKRGYNPYSSVFRTQPGDEMYDLVCTGTATLSAAQLTEDESVDDEDDQAIGRNYRIADTITVTLATTSTTPKGISASLGTTGYGAPDPTAYSPANDTPAFLLIPDMGGGDLYLEIYVGTATSCNALVEAFE